MKAFLSFHFDFTFILKAFISAISYAINRARKVENLMQCECKNFYIHCHIYIKKKRVWLLVWGPALAVMGGDRRSVGCGFESPHRILGE